jgi:type I restriction enzyme, S subunit
MSDQIVTFSKLASENLIEVGAGRPRSVQEQYPSIPILRVADVLDGRIESPSHGDISDSYGGLIESKISRPGDVVLTAKGTVGRVALMPPDGPAFAYSPQLCYFRPVASGPIRSRYLYYWFKSTQFWNQADALKGQTDMADYLSLSDIQALRIGIPALGQQDGIIDVLGVLDDKIAVNDRIAETAYGLSQACSLRAHESVNLAKLSDIANITMGSSPPGESYNEDGIGMPFYQGTRDFGKRFPGRRVWSVSPVRTASPGSCLVSVRAPVGRVNISRELCCIGRGVAAVQSKQGTPSVLFHELVAASHVWLPFESEGTVFGAINKQQLANIEIPALDPVSAQSLEELIRPLDRQVATAYDENMTLAALRDSLLPKLMSGEIRVRDAEKVVEDVT